MKSYSFVPLAFTPIKNNIVESLLIKTANDQRPIIRIVFACAGKYNLCHWLILYWISQVIIEFTVKERKNDSYPYDWNLVYFPISYDVRLL